MQDVVDWMPESAAGQAGGMQKDGAEPGSREKKTTSVSAGPGCGGAGSITWALGQ